MILGRYILIELELNLKCSEHIIKADYGPFKWHIAPLVDSGTYIFNILNKEKIKPGE